MRGCKRGRKDRNLNEATRIADPRGSRYSQASFCWRMALIRPGVRARSKRPKPPSLGQGHEVPVIIGED